MWVPTVVWTVVVGMLQSVADVATAVVIDGLLLMRKRTRRGTRGVMILPVFFTFLLITPRSVLIMVVIIKGALVTLVAASVRIWKHSPMERFSDAFS
jgi:chromate transport protein ChrA